MRRELMEEMMAFACRSLAHSQWKREIKQLDDGAEGRVITPENENLENKKIGG